MGEDARGCERWAAEVKSVWWRYHCRGFVGVDLGLGLEFMGVFDCESEREGEGGGVHCSVCGELGVYKGPTA
jgi:hypothetical protein